MSGLKKDKKNVPGSFTKIPGRRKMLCLFAMLIFSCLMWQKASALDRLLYQDSAIVYVGGTVSLRSYISEEFLGTNYSGDYNADNPEYEIAYNWNDTSQEPACARLDADGTVTALSPGTVKADVTFTYNDIEQTETVTIEMRDPEEASITYGGNYTLAAAGVYDTGRYIYTSSDAGIVVNGDGSITAKGFKGGSVYVSGDDGNKIEVARVSVAAPEFARASETRAVGTSPYIPEILNYTPDPAGTAVKWDIADETVASVSGGGIAAITPGETDIAAVITPESGDTVRFTTKLTVTDPELPESDYVIAAGIKKTVKLDGICDTSVVDWNIGKSEMGFAYFKKEGKLYANDTGNDVITINADGREIQVNVTVTDPFYNGDSIATYKGSSEEINIKGLDEDKSTVTYKSSKKAVATVDEDGYINARKAGNVVITVNADGREIKIPVEVASVKGYKASKKAISISNTKTRYSQAKRMQKGYYDCSSLVWRIYSKYDVYFGVKSGWAPTAAEIAKWCSENGKKIYNKAVSPDKLLPGDLVFFSYTKNGRYKNISHVEIYTGDDMDVSASSSNNKVIHYDYSQNNSIVMIARPVE